MKNFHKFFYFIKPAIPRRLQIYLRRKIVLYKKDRFANIWPINPDSRKPPDSWRGWPGNKKFALVLTHDVDTKKGHDRCTDLMTLEEGHGFRSSFNFVPERYSVSPELRARLVGKGFEVGVHGLNHDCKYYISHNRFMERSARINFYLKEWNAVGYRAPSMLHKLDWFHSLNIKYDASTFDTDPFEPNSQGMTTIFPFFVKGKHDETGYVELPYTLPQDFTLFVLLKQNNSDIWKRKLDWLAENGGMALMISHPDYMNFGNTAFDAEDYPVEYYSDFLEYVKSRYEGSYWHALPKDVASYWKRQSYDAEDKL